MTFEIQIPASFTPQRFCEATRFIQNNFDLFELLSLNERKAYYAVLSREHRTRRPNRVVYKLSRGGWKTAYVDETLTQFFTKIILPLWDMNNKG